MLCEVHPFISVQIYGLLYSIFHFWEDSPFNVSDEVPLKDLVRDFRRIFDSGTESDGFSGS
jgi:hypothetical protein